MRTCAGGRALAGGRWRAGANPPFGFGQVRGITGAGAGTARALLNGVMETCSLQGVSRGRLLREFSILVAREQGDTADMLAYLAEIDRRKLYLEHAYPSMFAFCTQRFRMSEAIAAKRIRAGRAAGRFPRIFGMIRRGELHLSGVHQLAGHLTEGNHAAVLRRAKGRSMREIDVLIAEIAPKPDAVSMIRALPGQRADRAGDTIQQEASLVGSATGLDGALPSKQALEDASNAQGFASRNGNAEAAGRRARNLATPLSPGRYKLQVTIGQEARDKLAELQNLLSHQIPDGDPAAVVERALDVLLAETKKKREALADKPRAARKKHGGRTRAIPAHVRREVFKRDEGRCAFVDGQGRRCESAWQLEFHHCVPYGRDGPHTTDNIELRCRAHNQWEAELEYGRRFMATRRAGAGRGGSGRGPP